MSEEKNIKKENGFLKELLLICFGVFLGIIGNQIFFKENKDYEMKVELQKELLKEQYEYLNTILLFTHKYEIGIMNSYIVEKQVLTYLEQGTNKIIKVDTLRGSKIDSISLIMPSFLLIEEKRQQFLDDINFIKNNRTKIDHLIYERFEDILDFLNKNPIPKNSSLAELKICNWNNENIKEDWKELLGNLYSLTYQKLD